MSGELEVECGYLDTYGRRSVSVRCGRKEYRDRFDTSNPLGRQSFAEVALAKLRLDISVNSVVRLDRLIVRESAACDSRTFIDRQRPRVRPLTEVQPSDVEWLWPGRIATGTVTMLAGDPGLGKSLVTLDMAARVSRGTEWPDVGPPSRGGIDDESAGRLAAPTSPASVMLLSAEDDPSKIIHPRLLALGADFARVRVFDGVEGRHMEGVYLRPFQLDRDISHLSSAVEGQGDCRLVVIDPISAYLGRVSENVNTKIRGLLMSLMEMATKYNLAVVAVTHLRKESGGTICRTMGSMALVAATRASWMITEDPNQPRRRLMLPVKNNLAGNVGGLSYTIEPSGPNGAPIVCWSPELVQMPVDRVLSGGRQAIGRPDREREEVIEWLGQRLATGPLPAKEVREAAEAHGFSYATLRRAFRALAGKTHKSRGEAHGGWMWQLPEPDRQDVQNSPPSLRNTLLPQDDQNPPEHRIQRLA